MSDLHKKINPADLQNDSFLLPAEARDRVRQVQADLDAFREEVRPHLEVIAKADAAINNASAQLELADNPASGLALLTISSTQDAEAYREEVLQKLEAFKLKFKDDDVLAFIDKVRARVAETPVPTEDARDELNMLYDEIIDDMSSSEGGELADPALSSSAQETLNHQMDLKYAAEDAVAEVRTKIETYQSENNLDFDLDVDFNLAKISKRSEGLSFSVIFTEGEGGIREPYALYTGKERKLGEGTSAPVKLCQNLNTGDWQAVKILQAREASDFKSEGDVLKALERYHGNAERGGKFYVVQTLLPGVELKEHLQKQVSPNLASRLEIASQALGLVEAFHKEFLHRDIKPGNFMWDEATQTLSLCDFGFSSRLGEPSTEAFGSTGFTAPEIEATPDGQPMPYSKKSDIYALGKTFEKLFEGIDDVPPEVESLIQKMTKTSPEARLCDIAQMQDVMHKALDEAPRPNSPQAAAT